jgi:hypothetical protein
MAAVALAVGAAVWLPMLHVWYTPRAPLAGPGAAVSPLAGELLARQLQLWEEPAARERELARMRRSNAEWDFMGRTYLVLALANVALREPAAADRFLAVIDRVIDETLRLEAERGMTFFLMDYVRAKPFVAKPARSTFIDGEIALMLAARQLVRPADRYAAPLAARVDAVADEMAAGPALCGESYPDECWVFCNTLGLAALRLSDHVDGRDHGPFLRRWVARAKENLVDRRTGLLVSSLRYDGTPLDGPEGSSLWMAAHCLQLVDPAFARDQYDRARGQIGRTVLGFGYAREWPAAWTGPADVDSGPVVPVLGASAGASGLAVVGAAAFGDDAYLRQLLASLEFAAFPVRAGGGLTYAAGNQVGDAVLLYALVQGPLWAKATEGSP